jgi:hypothetical protein
LRQHEIDSNSQIEEPLFENEVEDDSAVTVADLMTTFTATGSEISQHVVVADEGHVELIEDVDDEVEDQRDITKMSLDEEKDIAPNLIDMMAILKPIENVTLFVHLAQTGGTVTLFKFSSVFAVMRDELVVYSICTTFCVDDIKPCITVNMDP